MIRGRCQTPEMRLVNLKVQVRVRAFQRYRMIGARPRDEAVNLGSNIACSEYDASCNFHELLLFVHDHSRCVRAAKEMDSKSIGLCPHVLHCNTRAPNVQFPNRCKAARPKMLRERERETERQRERERETERQRDRETEREWGRDSCPGRDRPLLSTYSSCTF